MSKVLTDTDYAAVKGAFETGRDDSETPNRSKKMFKAALAKLSPGVTTYDDLQGIVDGLDSDGYNTREDYFDHLADNLPETVKVAMGYE